MPERRSGPTGVQSNILQFPGATRIAPDATAEQLTALLNDESHGAMNVAAMPLLPSSLVGGRPLMDLLGRLFRPATKSALLPDLMELSSYKPGADVASKGQIMMHGVKDWQAIETAPTQLDKLLRTGAIEEAPGYEGKGVDKAVLKVESLLKKVLGQ